MAVIDVNTLVTLFFLWAVPLFIGAAAPPLFRWLMDLQPRFICEVYQERGGEYFLVKRVKKGLGEDTFNVGERQYIIDPTKVVLYNDNHPVLHYVLDKTKPRNFKIRPEMVKVSTPAGKDTESKSVNLFYRRSAIEQMIRATRSVDWKANLPMLIMVGVLGFALAYAAFTSFHPGLYPAPPPGYEYKAVPINATSTVTLTK